MNPFLPQKVKILDVRQLTADTKLFRLDFKAKHEPGQFVQAGLFGIGECPISISSHSENYIELCIRNVGNVTKFITKLKKGDYVYVRGPYGSGYHTEGFKGKNIIIVGGGTGTAPLRGVVKYIEKTRADYPRVDIFLGFRSPADILFRDELDSWEKFSNFYITVDKADANWKGNVGFTMPLIEKAKVNKNNTIAVTCGPPIMIKFVIEKLKQMGFDDSQIYVSYERLMQCGVGKCGHCAVAGKLVCRHGPVFNYSDAKYLED